MKTQGAAEFDHAFTDDPGGAARITKSVIDPGGIGAPELRLLDISLSPAPEMSIWMLMASGAAMLGAVPRFGRREGFATAV